jgi:hypothetical protein
MYPQLDFRSLIEDPIQNEATSRAILREPLQEVLRYWKKSGYPPDKLAIYSKGIYDGIVNHRWMFFQLDMIADYPEFYQSTYDALMTLWNKLSLSLYLKPAPALSISNNESTSTFGKDQFILNWSIDQRKILLQQIRQKLSIELLIDQQYSSVGIFPSREAQDIYQRIYWLKSALISNGIVNPEKSST